MSSIPQAGAPEALPPREIVLKTGEVMAASAAHGHVSPPLGTDAEITISSNSLFERISAEVIKILAAPDSREKLESLGYEPIGNTPAQAAAVMAAEQKKWTAVIREAGISSD